VSHPHLFSTGARNCANIGSMPLLEREASLHAIEVATAHAERGRGSVLLIEGPAGIGKSALLAAARRPGPRWLKARGGELERELPLGVARQLLEPAVDAAPDGLLQGTGPAATALAGQPTGDDDTTALLHGVHRLVRNLAERDPLVLEVDDVHWADAASLRVLAFLTRRLEGLPVLLLIARRAGERSVDEAALAAIASAPLTERRSLLPLTQSAVAGVVAAHGGAGADSGFTVARSGCGAKLLTRPSLTRKRPTPSAVSASSPPSTQRSSSTDSTATVAPCATNGRGRTCWATP